MPNITSANCETARHRKRERAPAHATGASTAFSGLVPRRYQAQATQLLKQGKGLQWLICPGYSSAGQIYRQF